MPTFAIRVMVGNDPVWRLAVWRLAVWRLAIWRLAAWRLAVWGVDLRTGEGGQIAHPCALLNRCRCFAAGMSGIRRRHGVGPAHRGTVSLDWLSKRRQRAATAPAGEKRPPWAGRARTGGLWGHRSDCGTVVQRQARWSLPRKRLHGSAKSHLTCYDLSKPCWAGAVIRRATLLILSPPRFCSTWPRPWAGGRLAPCGTRTMSARPANHPCRAMIPITAARSWAATTAPCPSTSRSGMNSTMSKPAILAFSATPAISSSTCQ